MKKLNFEEAKEKAIKDLRLHFENVYIPDGIDLLDDNFIRGKYFWIFFPNKNIIFSEKNWFEKQFCCCVIGEYGGTRYMRDLRNKPTELQKALDGLAISHHPDNFK
ncbi:Hemolysin [Granulibacter bethesdensis]|uniref:Hemolysin n=1 Tax=Granulibacter bethesdensis TaxID=364410 RepID=A0AAC9K881_9PROT|nr:hypothetical protein [Granulibacter bethesdensis]APH55060.1 Hemolysin [Granulibacter bethesdensis]APH62646.1 Hemolysin [Granulibacter bethesdensis]